MQKVETLNNGKLVEQTKGEIFFSVDCIDYCIYISDSCIIKIIFNENIDAGWVNKIIDETIPGSNDQFIYT